jgi:intracellular septation protein
MKKQIIDFAPIVIFFLVFFSTKDFMLATFALVIGTALQLLTSWILFKQIERMQWIPFVILLPLAGLTIAFDDERFLQWKPSIVNWLFAAVLWVSAWVFDKNWVKTALEAALGANKDIQLSTDTVNWKALNFYTGLFFLFVGLTNLFVFTQFSTEVWVQFRLFGMLGLNIVGMMILFGYLSKHIKMTPTDTGSQGSTSSSAQSTENPTSPNPLGPSSDSKH